MRNRKLNIYKRKDGRYEGRAYLAGGKYKSVYGKTEKEAAEKLLDLLKEQSISKVRCRRYFNDLLDEWLCSLNIKESSVYCYRTKVENHIHPYFSGVKYENVDEMTMKNFMRELLNKHLSSKYINDIISIVKSFAKWAWKKYRYENKISDVSTPKIVQNKTTLLSAEEHRKLCDYVKNQPYTYNIGIYITMNTGIRIGELCALQWKDIDLDRKIMRISKTVQRLPCTNGERKTAVRITSPKTTSSVREIPLPDYLADYLKQFVESGDTYVLSGTSKLVEPRAMTNYFKRTLKKADLPSVKFHSLRHSFATNCLQVGFDIKTLSEILGHANAATTMKIYVHSSMERKRECMSMLTSAA